MGSCLCCVHPGRGEYLPVRDGAKSEEVSAAKPRHQLFSSKSSKSSNRSGKVPVKHTKHVVAARDGSGNKLINQYLVCRTVDSGSSGKVKLVLDTSTQEYYAVKQFNRAQLMRKKLGSRSSPADGVFREIRILERLNSSEYVIKLFEIMNDDGHDHVYVVLEYVSGGSLMSLQGDNPLPEARAKTFFCDVVRGLEYIHSFGVIHRDIKPENLLLSAEGTVKICDFSVSQIFEDGDDTISTSAGSPAFLAPELISNQGYAQGFSSDVWSLGVTLYYFLFGRVPFVGSSIPHTYERIQNSSVELPPPRDTHLSPEVLDLLLRLLNKDPSRRINLAEIKRHPWVASQF